MKNPKNWTFHITWGSIQEWGCNIADTVVSNQVSLEFIDCCEQSTFASERIWLKAHFDKAHLATAHLTQSTFGPKLI